jgi:Tfp pilus assembly protein PilV
MSHPIKQKKCHRGGFTIVELLAAVFILTACIVAFSQLVVFVASQRAAEGIRQNAVDQLQNVFEQIAVISDEKLAALDFDKKEYEARTLRAVPDGKLTFSCKPADETAALQSYVFEANVSWSRGEKQQRGNVSLFRLLTVNKSGKGETE